MDTGLKLVVERSLVIINSYLENLDPLLAKDMKKERFHLIQAKQALMKCLVLSDPRSFVARRMVNLYDEQLKRIAIEDDTSS